MSSALAVERRVPAKGGGYSTCANPWYVYVIGPGSWKVTRPQFIDLKPRSIDDVVNLAIEAAPTADSLPDGRESVLPRTHTRIESAAMFEKN